MRYIRLLLSWFLSAFLLFSLPLTAYAGTATSSTASRSDALRPPDPLAPMDDFVDSDGFDDVPLMGGNEPTGLPPVENTVNLSKVYAHLYYYDMSGAVRSKFIYCGSDGYFRFERPADFASIYFFAIGIERGALPSAGKYSLAVNCHTNSGGSTYFTKFSMNSMKKNNNASAQSTGTMIDGLTNFSEFGYRVTVNLGYVTNIYFSAHYDRSQPFGFPFDGYVKVNFTKLGADANVGFDTPGSGTASEDLQQGMADNSAQQVEQGDTIIELIKNTIQTISSQLTAFWNQLAGEFTNLYNKMNQQHSEQLEADRQNTDDLISNQDKNTDTVVNGYDNQGMNSDNDRLNSSLTEYGQAEDNLMGDVNKHIGSIDFDYSFDSVVNVIGSVSDFFQGIYERSGQFQIVINVCLILSLASCAVGIYRLKGGG